MLRGVPGDAERELARAAFDAVAGELAAHRYPVGGYRSAGPLSRQGPGAPGAETGARGEPVARLGPGRLRARVEHASHGSVEALARRVALDLAVEAAGAGWRASARTRGVVRRRVSPALAARLLLPRGRRAGVEKSRASELWARAGHPVSDPAALPTADARHNGWRSRSRAGWGSIRHGWSRRTRIRFTSSGAPAPRPRPPRRAGGSPRSHCAAAPSPSVCRARTARRPVTSCRFPGITPAPAGSAAPGVSVAASSILHRAALPWATACRSTA